MRRCPRRFARRFLLLLAASALLAGPARAQRINAISVGDMPGTGGQWQMGEVTVVAPAALVQRWFSDVDRWSARFPDIESVQVLGRASDGKTVAFRSSIIGRTVTIRTHEVPGRITYEGRGPSVTTQGRIFIEPLGPDLTRVVAQSTGQVHGPARMFVSDAQKRDRSIKKLRSDLQSVTRLANQWAQARRARG